MALSIMQQPNIEDYLLEREGPGPKKIPGTGLTIYEGGVEKTPTGKSNAFVESGLKPEDIAIAIKTHGLPATSNRDFQEAAIRQLVSTPLGQQHLAEMEQTFGPTKSGSYVDDKLGARTKFLIEGLNKVNEAKHIHEDKPLISPSYTNNKLEYLLDFGRNKQDYANYRNRITSMMSNTEVKNMLDSARRGLAPVGAKFVKAQDAKGYENVMNQFNQSIKDYEAKHGKVPEISQTYSIPNDQQSEALRKYLGQK